MATIDTTNGKVIASNGIECAYSLEKKRQWNIGRRKHVMELTGRIIVTFPNGSYNIYSNWDSVKDNVEAVATRMGG